MIRVSLLGTVATLLCGTALAQTASAPAAATQPAGSPDQAVVVRLTGQVTAQPPGADAWQPVKQGQRLAPRTRIRTGLRSRVVLAFGDNSIAEIAPVTLAAIEDFRRGSDTTSVTLDLGHGQIRATAVETTLRSEMTIQSPTATLSKKGTHDYGMRYDAGTGNYTIFLNQEGLVEAFNNMTGQARTLRQGQFVTQAMLRWIETARLVRYAPVIDTWGSTVSEIHFNVRHGSGLGSIEPGGGADTYTLSLKPGGGGGGIGVLPPTGLNTARQGTPAGVFNRPEGNFGTGTP